MVIREEKNISREESGAFLSKIDGATFFHTHAWLDSISSAFRNIEPSWLVARDAGHVRGLMPICRIRRNGLFILSALPFGTYGVPLSDDNEIVMSLLSKFRQVGRSFRCLESVASLYGMDALSLNLPSKEIRDEECLVIDIRGGFERYRSKQISRKKRQICNGCEKHGIEARPLSSSEEVSLFYDLYIEASRNWSGVHPYPRAFFDNLFERRSEGVLIWGAFQDGRILGGHIDFYFGNHAQAWQAGMDADSDVSGIASWLVYNAVKEACRRGIDEFNLGSSGGDKGMIFFKESMGGLEKTYSVMETRKNWWKLLRK
ncbi:MAG: GNAT family N-acetyltransferase [Candidatus Krumholzibacteria bacterium]|nr:GNAT family N-acetyltransferase [Candidatus Krumholzibacteria bacterium]